MRRLEVGPQAMHGIEPACGAEGARLDDIPSSATTGASNDGGDAKDLDSLATEWAALKVEPVTAAGRTWSARAAKTATTTIPIIMPGSAEPVRDGRVASRAHPGSNITGNSAICLDTVPPTVLLRADEVNR